MAEARKEPEFTLCTSGNEPSKNLGKSKSNKKRPHEADSA